jgi:hypothetical protein
LAADATGVSHIKNGHPRASILLNIEEGVRADILKQHCFTSLAGGFRKICRRNQG